MNSQNINNMKKIIQYIHKLNLTGLAYGLILSLMAGVMTGCPSKSNQEVVNPAQGNTVSSPPVVATGDEVPSDASNSIAAIIPNNNRKGDASIKEASVATDHLGASEGTQHKVWITPHATLSEPANNALSTFQEILKSKTDFLGKSLFDAFIKNERLAEVVYDLINNKPKEVIIIRSFQFLPLGTEEEHTEKKPIDYTRALTNSTKDLVACVAIKKAVDGFEHVALQDAPHYRAIKMQSLDPSLPLMWGDFQSEGFLKNYILHQKNKEEVEQLIRDKLGDNARPYDQIFIQIANGVYLGCKTTSPQPQIPLGGNPIFNPSVSSEQFTLGLFNGAKQELLKFAVKDGKTVYAIPPFFDQNKYKQEEDQHLRDEFLDLLKQYFSK